MRKNIYISKTAGAVTVTIDENYSTIQAGAIQARSLNMEKLDTLLPEYTRLLSTPENITFFYKGSIWTEEEVSNYLQEEQGKWNNGNPFSIFSVYQTETGRYIGYILIKYDKEGFLGHHNTVEIGYILDKEFWGRGYGTLMAVMAKKYVKDVIAHSDAQSSLRQITEITATVHPQNQGSKTILERTLKRCAPEEFDKFPGQPRYLFFKPLPKEHSELSKKHEETATLSGNF